jgi:hypothetical protein
VDLEVGLQTLNASLSQSDIRGKEKRELSVSTCDVTTVGPSKNVEEFGGPTGDDLEVWKVISDSSQASDFETFLEQYPDSVMAPFARKRLEQLR